MRYAIIAALALGLAGGAQAATMDIDDFAVGTAVNSLLFSDGTIARVDTVSNRTNGTDQAVVFGTESPTGNDSDLQSPFQRTGTSDGDDPLAPENILIILGPDNGQGLPDDDRLGGTITFTFNRIVDILGFDYFDTEDGGNELIVTTNTLFTSGELVAGDGQYDSFDQRLNGVTSITFEFGGSGGFDNLTIAPVPVPAALPLLLAGLGGLGMMARRKKRQA